MPSITKARLAALETLEAMCGAQGAQLVATIQNEHSIIAQQSEDIRALERRLDAAESEARLAAATYADAARIMNKAQLMARAKALSASGVPCTMRGNFILHSKTGAILAQVAQ